MFISIYSIAKLRKLKGTSYVTKLPFKRRTGSYEVNFKLPCAELASSAWVGATKMTTESGQQREIIYGHRERSHVCGETEKRRYGFVIKGNG